MSYTKKVVTTWISDSYLQPVENNSSGPQATAWSELNAKVSEMEDAGKMSKDSITQVNVDEPYTISLKWLIDQAAADEWIQFTEQFASKYNFTKKKTLTVTLG